MKVTDALLLALCAMLILSAPLMAALELVRAQDNDGIDAVNADHTYRVPWRAAILVGVLAIDALGSAIVVRVALQPRARPFASRLLAILLAGMALLVVAFLLDARPLADVTARLRAAGIVWAYPIGAVLVAGAALRLQEVETLFPELTDPTPLSVRARQRE